MLPTVEAITAHLLEVGDSMAMEHLLSRNAEEAFELGKRWAKGKITTKEQPVSKLYKRTKRTLIID